MKQTKSSNDDTNEDPLDQDNRVTDSSLEMSLSSYSNTDESVQSNLDSAAEDLHSDYESSSCEREYVLNADDDKNNNYFPNLDQKDKASDSANSSYYGSVEDALDEMACPDAIIANPPNQSLAKNDEAKTSAIFDYIEDQQKQIYDEIRDSNKFETDKKQRTESESDKNVFTRKNYWDFCNQQKLDNQKISTDDKTDEFQSFPRENPFGSDFSKWDVGGAEFEKLRQDSSVDDLMTWDSVHKPSTCPDRGATIDLITGDTRSDDRPQKKDHVKTWSRNFPEVIGPRSPANMKKECAAMLQSKLASAKEPAYLYRPRSMSNFGQQNQIWANNRYSFPSGDKMKRSFSMQNGRRNKKISPELKDNFDVYNIETAMPTIDWAAMEQHLAKSAKEQELYHKVGSLCFPFGM